MAKIKGICKNIDGCDLAAEKLEQEVEKSNFVCSECGKPLYRTDDSTGGSGGDDSGSTLKKIIIGVVAVVAVGGGAYFGFFRGNTDGNGGDSDTTVVSLEVDSLNTVNKVDSTSVEKSQPDKEDDKPNPTPDATKVNLSCAVYDGPISGGKPNGLGGTLTFNKSYTIDLKDGKGSTLSVGSGDKIVDTKFDNGVLKQGELHRKSGERKYFSGVSEKF